MPEQMTLLLRLMREMLPTATANGELDGQRQSLTFNLLVAANGRTTVRAETGAGCTAAEIGAGTDADRNGDAGSDDEQQARDTPQQRAAAQVWDACSDGPAARTMVQHGLLDVCTALLEHSLTVGDGARSPSRVTSRLGFVVDSKSHARTR